MTFAAYLNFSLFMVLQKVTWWCIFVTWPLGAKRALAGRALGVSIFSSPSTSAAIWGEKDLGLADLNNQDVFLEVF